MPRVTRIVSNSQDEQKKKRTAAYCRVSTDSTDQINSLANQVRTYTKKINKNPEWELVDIFADEGLSGTSMNKRDDLLRLLDMCRHGLVDLIICKSISRFGRNTREVLETVRELKLLGIAVHFEKEGIYTLNLGDEMLLSTFAAIAEEESVAISHNVRFTIKKKMQNGTYVNGCVPYGFRLIDGVMIPYESEAIIVRLLFKHYLEGYSTPALVRWLEEEGVLTKNGNTKWNIRIVSRMLSNEKYVGDTLYQKKYKEPTVPFKQRINYGQEEQYYCTGTHQGIVDRETFDKVQALLQKRRATFAKRTHENYQFYPLSSKIRCKECGNVFRRRVSNGCISWGCSTHIADRLKCDSHYYKEERIYDSFIGIINCLRFGSFDILVNAVGGNKPAATTNDKTDFFNLDSKAVGDVMILNLMGGAMLPCQVFGPDLVNNENGGVIINISSMNAFRPLTRIPCYSAAKAAVSNFTQWLAVDMAQKYGEKIRVNAIAPGFFLTDQNRFLLTNEADGSLTKRGEQILTHTPMGRFGDPEDLIGTLVWLCSDASKFVTGIVVPVDGGFSAYSGV